LSANVLVHKVREVIRDGNEENIEKEKGWARSY
jgi:hypothetical protein